MESLRPIQTRQYPSRLFGLILGISQEWAELNRSALLELLLAGWNTTVAYSTQEIRDHS